MKDEEMAGEYAGNISGLDINTTIMVAENKTDAYRLGIYDGFLAGLKAGRPQWHEVADGDLPKNSPYFSGQSVRVIGAIPLSEDKYISLECRYFYSEKKWKTQEDCSVVKVIAWCEIPTFDKE